MWLPDGDGSPSPVFQLVWKNSVTVCTILCSSVLVFCCAVGCCTKQYFKYSVFWSVGICSRFAPVSLLLIFWSPINSNWWQVFKLCPVPGTEFSLYWKNVYLILTVLYNSVKEFLNVHVYMNFLVIMKNTDRCVRKRATPVGRSKVIFMCSARDLDLVAMFVLPFSLLCFCLFPSFLCSQNKIPSAIK